MEGIVKAILVRTNDLVDITVIGLGQELLKIIRRIYHPKAATVDLIEIEPSLVLRNCLPTADANRVMNW